LLFLVHQGGLQDFAAGASQSKLLSPRSLWTQDDPDLALTGVVDRLTQDASRLLGSMEAHRVLRIDEINPPLSLAL
jgi:hypothetical protein